MASAAASFLIECHDLRKQYEHAEEPVVALDGVDLEIARGEMVAVVGSSGSGKSTLLHLLGGLLRPSSGTVLFDGVDLTRLEEARLAEIRLARMGLVFQDACLISSLTVVDNVRLPLYLGGNLKGGLSRAHELLREVGLEGRDHHYPRELSRGEMQKVAVARAMIRDPDLLLVDEPTASLDEASSRAVRDLLGGIRQCGQHSIVLATHDRSVAAAADRVVELSFGRRVKSGGTAP